MADQVPTTFLQKLQFRPGVNREATFYANAGGYWDSSRVRFRDGRPESIGGWQKNTDEQFAGVCRALFAWTDLSSNRLLAVGTSYKYYIRYGQDYYDITPIRSTGTFANNPFAATIGSTTVTVTHTNHGAAVNDYVTIAGATTFAGIPAGDLNKEHQILTVPDSGTYTIAVATAATSTASGGGAAATYAYQINTGLNTVILGSGWGAGGWGEGGWGQSANVFVSSEQLRVWSQDQFGEDLIFNPRDGGVYYWDTSAGLSTRGVLLSSLGGAADVPLMASQIMVSTNDRHVIAFGCNAIGETTQDRLLIRWSNQEDPAVWTPSITTTAGDLRIGIGSSILRAIKFRQEILVFTDISLHSLQWLGAPYFFGLQTVSANTSMIAPNAVVDTGDMIIWMGQDNFYAYTGRVQPLPCSLKEFVFSDINLIQSHKIHAVTNKQFDEATFFYCSADSEECDRYITFNYKEGLWYRGELSRTAFLDQGLLNNPMAAHTDGYLYDHELGSSDGESDPPASIGAWIETSPIEIGQGDRFMLVRRMLPDLSFMDSTATAPTLDVELTGYTYPGGGYSPTEEGTVTRTSAVTLERFTNSVPLRIRARSIAFRYSTSQVGVKWRIGDPRIEMRVDGKR